VAEGIPLLTGTMKDEWRLFSSASPRLRFMSRSTWEARVQKVAGKQAPDTLAAYSQGTTFDRFNAFMTDRVFTMPAIRMLEAQSAKVPVYAYRFDWRSRLLGGIMGSCHALELGFVFGTYNRKLAGAFFGTGPAADVLADAMMDCWTSFARSGSPSTASVHWPEYDHLRRNTMIFGDGPPHGVERPNESRRLAWENVTEVKLKP
jgi:para-nitrobenzyl esterase